MKEPTCGSVVGHGILEGGARKVISVLAEYRSVKRSHSKFDFNQPLR